MRPTLCRPLEEWESISRSRMPVAAATFWPLSWARDAHRSRPCRSSTTPAVPHARYAVAANLVQNNVISRVLVVPRRSQFRPAETDAAMAVAAAHSRPRNCNGISSRTCANVRVIRSSSLSANRQNCTILRTSRQRPRRSVVDLSVFESFQQIATKSVRVETCPD